MGEAKNSFICLIKKKKNLFFSEEIAIKRIPRWL